MGRRRRRRNQLLDDLKETGGFKKLKEETLDRNLWRTRFRRSCGPVVRELITVGAILSATVQFWHYEVHFTAKYVT
jgi:hypothetical protein